MKKLCVLVAFAGGLQATAQQAPYWQQQANYTIDVSLDDKKHMLRGHEEIEYINHSPDALKEIYIHLWMNAYRNDRTAFARQLARDKEGSDRLAKFRDRGSIDSLQFTVNGQPASYQNENSDPDVIRLTLAQPIAPGARAIIRTPFVVDLPEYISRGGHRKQDYMICQWFPKVAVYDRKGWHAFPYLDQGEFYSDFGSYNVSITVPSSYFVGASGVLQNAGELAQYKAIGSANRAAGSRSNTVAYVPPPGATKTLSYRGDSIPDFAWFASKDFTIRYDTMQLDNRSIDVFTFHHPDGNSNWVNSTDYVKSGARAYSGYLGAYPHPVVQAVEGPKNESSGGMEYPMITLITSPDATGEALDAVITHEVGHNWFMAILGSNERTHAWLDEGLNTYFQFRYEAERYRYNSIFGNNIPAELRKMPPADFQAVVYKAINDNMTMDGPIDIPSADYPSKDEYALSTYIKTALWLYVMELQLGRETVDRAFHSYYAQWKFRHPYPEDLKAAFDAAAGTDTAPYFDLLKKKGKL
ncbi:M1 family metallopeptidase [Flaviaesturariibacter aridisoli]|uniref:M1 family peptidase n=1 Tax=Flaviaesturariibacter aridisoli TaxID=2545761 RepID=A0A4R4E998_9BACT|nr:M1 family metallopeptidase [Flaviaesturariibacter aridisoli]TCZ74365.1 M1 family peptidase [Flaviaesturariibacter aridisoli]